MYKMELSLGSIICSLFTYMDVHWNIRNLCGTRDNSLHRSVQCLTGCLALNSNSSSSPPLWQPKPSPPISKILSRAAVVPRRTTSRGNLSQVCSFLLNVWLLHHETVWVQGHLLWSPRYAQPRHSARHAVDSTKQSPPLWLNTSPPCLTSSTLLLQVPDKRCRKVGCPQVHVYLTRIRVW